jgi:hypothetical protein
VKSLWPREGVLLQDVLQGCCGGIYAAHTANMVDDPQGLHDFLFGRTLSHGLQRKAFDAIDCAMRGVQSKSDQQLVLDRERPLGQRQVTGPCDLFKQFVIISLNHIQWTFRYVVSPSCVDGLFSQIALKVQEKA